MADPEAAAAGDPLSPRDHPARSLVAILALLALGFLAVALLRPRDEGPEAALANRIGVSLRLVIRTEPGAAPDDRDWFEPVTPVELGEHEGAPSVRLLLEEMSPFGEPGAPAHLWIPLERILEVWAGAERVYRRRE